MSDATHDRVMSEGTTYGPTRKSLGDGGLVAQPGPIQPTGDYHFVPAGSDATACDLAVGRDWRAWDIVWPGHFQRCQRCRAALGEV